MDSLRRMPPDTSPPSDPHVATPEPRRQAISLKGAFRALQHHNYRLLWFGTLVSSSGDWMDQIAFNWLVYSLTGSAIYLGLVNLCRMVPVLALTLFGGVVADRVERRRLMFTTQSAAMLMAFILATLVVTNLVQVWVVFVIAFGRGVMMSFNQPARQSLLSELVPTQDLSNAIALHAATLNLTRIIGPAIGGLLLATVGVAGAFYLNAASFLAVLYSLAMMRLDERLTKRLPNSVLADLVDGLRYLYSRPQLRTIVLLALLPLTFATPYQTMLAVFAKDVLKVGGGGLGLLSASSGIGAVLGAMSIASIRSDARLGRLMLIGMASLGLSLVAFSLSPWLWLSLPLLAGVGLSMQVYQTINRTLVQLNVAQEYRGRILSFMYLDRGMVPLGTLLAGFGTATLGPQIAVGGMAALLLVTTVLATYFIPSIGNLSGMTGETDQSLV
ncbi:MAG: MFS transporter [Chloroflexi bacterium]|nr:MFS transporter [Chloroflexota bacterium]